MPDISQIIGAFVVLAIVYGVFKLLRKIGAALGRPQYGKAAKYALEAAELGSVESRRMLGEFYEKGNGVPQDPVEAYKWYALAEQAGDTAAALRKQSVSSSMSREQIAEAERRAKQWAASHPQK